MPNAPLRTICILGLLLCLLLCGCTAGESQPTEPAPSETSAPAATEPVTEPEPTETVPVNTAAIDYLKLLYPEDNSATPADYLLLDVIYVDEAIYKVVWTVDVSEELIRIVPNDDGTVTVDVTELCSQETPYVLTASIATAEGYRITHSWNHILPQTQDVGAIIEAAYALERGERLPYQSTLTGKVTSIEKEWSEDYGSITLIIQVEGFERKPILCYGLEGEGADTIQVGDIITVTGTLQNFSNTIEFDSGCKLVPPEEPAEEPAEQPTEEQP